VVPIARIRVHPDFRRATRFGAFDGEIDLDATRFEIVRMRGQIVVLGGRESFGTRFARASGIVGAAYVEFVNAEYNGRYWLPSFQRTEFQASFPPLGQSRPVFRIVSTIGDLVPDTGMVVPDTSVHPRVVVTWAPTDSVGVFSDWRNPLGTETSAVRADDFADLAPRRRPADHRSSLFSGSLGRVFRFNSGRRSVRWRRAGTGTAIRRAGIVGWRLRRLGLHRAHGAVGEARVVEARRADVRPSRRAYALVDERLRIPLGATDSGALPLPSTTTTTSTGAARGVSVTRVVGAIDVALVTAQAGFGQDRPERSRLSQGLFSTNGGFRLNRGATAGDYAFGSLDAEFHPSVTGDFARPGVGARLHYEYASGDLDWQRAELGLSARQYVGPLRQRAREFRRRARRHPPRSNCSS
jgi:hypothetical protein